MPEVVEPVPSILTAATPTLYTDPAVASGIVKVVVGASTIALVLEPVTLWYTI